MSALEIIFLIWAIAATFAMVYFFRQLQRIHRAIRIIHAELHSSETRKEVSLCVVAYALGAYVNHSGLWKLFRG